MTVDSRLRERRALTAGRRKARQFAVQALYEWEMASNTPTQIEMHLREDFDLKGVDDDYFRELVYRVPALVQELDMRFTPLLDRALDELGFVERALLRMATYELLHRVDVPYRVVIDESVSLAKKFGASQSYKYINSVLDRLAREVRTTETAPG